MFIIPAGLCPAGLELEYSTYLGGSGYEGSAYAHIGGVAVDSESCAYVSGITGSVDFPTKGSYQSSHGSYSDVFIAKFASSGSSLAYSTYLGGSCDDRNFSCAIDSDKCIYITGATGSDDYPVRNPFQSTNSGSNDAFISKISSSGSELIYSTYIGGSNTDIGYDIAVASDGQPYIVGDTYSQDYPTYNAYQVSYGGGDMWGGDAFVSGLSANGSSLIYSSYLGGVGYDYGNGICNIEQSAYCAVGYSGSTDFPTCNPYQAFVSNMGDAFIAILSKNGSTMIASTYYGGSSYDSAYDVASCDGDIYVSGKTISYDFPIVNAYQCSYSGGSYLDPGDVFVARISSSGEQIMFSTYLGGNDGDNGTSISVDVSGNAYMAGCTKSHNFPTVSAYQSSIHPGEYDSFVLKLSSSGSRLIYSTYLGGSAEDRGENLAVDSLGCVYMSGSTESEDYPTIDAYQASYAGAIDTFVSKFRWEPSPTPTPILPIVTMENGDYDGDGTSEIAIFRPATGSWKLSELGSTIFGREGDIPISGDYWGDGTSEIGVFRPATGSWLVRSLTRFAFGAVGDVPVPRDYDQDGKTDAAFFRAREGLWSVRDLTDIYFGKAGDVPLPADYDGDGWIDAAVFRPSLGLWAVRGLTRKWWGTMGDIPAPADYDRDGTTEMAIYRPPTGLWAGILSQEGPSRICLGLDGDIPVPANFDGGEWTQPAVFRPSSGLWAARSLTRCWFGSSGDIPVTK